MKICAIICEYNPFHNGHLYQLQEARRRSNADAVVCLMSGDFVQRGECAVTSKYVRAKHALLGGADAVLELPVPFATANAELFAKGALHLLLSIPDVRTLCFGAETEDAQAFLSAAALLNDEKPELSNEIKRRLKTGESYAKARAAAYAAYIPSELLTSPNNVLGLEYTKAAAKSGKSIEILPVLRKGSGYRDEALQGTFSSATAIRAAVQERKDASDALPSFVREDLPSRLPEGLERLEKYAILSKTPTEIARVCDCTEGLENAFKKAAEQDDSLVSTLTSARYTSSRIRRIALQNLLGIEEATLSQGLQEPLYLRLLAIRKENAALFRSLSESNFPLLTRAHDEDRLTGIAKTFYEMERFAEKVYTLCQDAPQRTRTLFL